MNVTVALRQLVEPSVELKSLFAVLSEKLETKGATVILLPPKASDGRLLKIWQVQVALAFTQIGDFSSEGSTSPSLRFYHCYKRQEESLAIIAAIVREMLRSKEIVSYSLAGRWEHWKKLCYYNFLRNTEVPSVLIELRYFRLNEETMMRLTDWIVNGLNYLYGEAEAKEAEENISGCQSKNIADSLTGEEDGLRNVPLSEITPYSATEEKAEEQTEEKAEEEPEEHSEEQKKEKTEEQTGEQIGKNMEDNMQAKSEEKISVATNQTPLETTGAKKPEKNERRIERLATTNAGPAGIKVGGRRRYRSGNPLAPPGDGPIYFFERKAESPELPPLIPQLWMQAARPSAHAYPALVKNVGQTGPRNSGITAGQESITNVLSQLKQLGSALLPPGDAQSTLEDSNKAPS